MRYYYFDKNKKILELTKQHNKSSDVKYYSKLETKSKEIVEYYISKRSIKCIVVLTAKHKKAIENILKEKQKGKGRRRIIKVIYSHHPCSIKLKWKICQEIIKEIQKHIKYFKE
jgi:hypothetical protein